MIILELSSLEQTSDFLQQFGEEKDTGNVDGRTKVGAVRETYC